MVLAVRMCAWARPTRVAIKHDGLGPELASGELATRPTKEVELEYTSLPRWPTPTRKADADEEARLRLRTRLPTRLSQPPPPPPARAGEPTPEEIPGRFLRSARFRNAGDIPLCVPAEMAGWCAVILKDVDKRHCGVHVWPVVDGDRSQEALVAIAPFDGEDGLGEELNVGFKFETVGHGRGRDGACGRAEGSWR